MYLKELTLRGFKSFASVTTLRFEPGITAVVGPNGSGKSNIVDALIWVMGEQGAKNLRGTSMEDVIFAGTSSRPPLGRAQVSLTIDNSDHTLDIDYTEVTISRTIFRNGGSEYAINGSQCRLLDIQELLSDTGLGQQMHVIVGQGRLDAILKADPSGHRAFIEEAAGILKHRKRKERALRKLANTETNLSRLDDLLGEIHRQVELSVKAGLVTTNDLLRVELRQQEIASNRLKVENGLKVSKMLLAQHIGVDWHAFDVAAAEFGQPEAPAAFYVPVEEALDNRAEYRLAEKNVEAQKYRKRMERGKRLPTVGVGAGYLYYNVTDKDVDDGLVFAQVSVPISDWWGGAHALKKARIREQQAENDRLQAREMLAVEIERTWSEVQESYAQILLTRRSVTSAAENLRQNRNFYQVGTAPLTDLLDAETLYTRSRNDFTSACAAYRTSLARYMRVTGR